MFNSTNFKHYQNNFSHPPGCLQYHTGVDGRFETFNFPGGSPVNMHLPNQDYRICIRQEEGIMGFYGLGSNNIKILEIIGKRKLFGLMFLSFNFRLLLY